MGKNGKKKKKAMHLRHNVLPTKTLKATNHCTPFNGFPKV